MPRPRRFRNISAMPMVNEFGPRNCDPFGVVILNVDEYEVIKLIDKEGMNQEECANQIGVARTTVQSIYAKARKKIAEALIDGKRLVIEGGNYKICPGKGMGRGQGRGQGLGRNQRRNQNQNM